VFTSDHGDMLGAHGGMMQKWHNAYDEAVRVPMLVSGPGVDAAAPGVQAATSHVDVLPTLLGLVGADVEAAAAEVSKHHVETQPFVGRDLSPLLAGTVDDDALDAPVYFMTEDQISRGLNMRNLFTGEPFEAIAEPGRVETVITRLPSGADGAAELWKLNHYYERLPEWEEAHGLAKPFAAEPADAEWELHNLTADPEERANRAADAADVLARLRTVLDETRESMRRTPQHVNARA
jgi:arylsulfatase A-like enzyme